MSLVECNFHPTTNPVLYIRAFPVSLCIRVLTCSNVFCVLYDLDLKSYEIKKKSKINICSLVQNTFIVSQQL